MPRRLTANERAEREYKRILESIRNEVRKDLERDTQKLLGDMRQQLVNELQNAFSNSTQQQSSSTGTGQFSSLNNLSRIVTSILRLTAKPRTTTTTFETVRSQDAFSQFRLSRGQMAADMGSELSNGEKNL